jgi:hypothetical protein
MKRRRTIGPKKEKNKSALLKFVLLAVVAAIVGGSLCYVSHLLINKPSIVREANQADGDIVAEPISSQKDGDKKKTSSKVVEGQREEDDTDATPVENKNNLSFFHYLFALLVMATIMTVVGLLFFGVRAYLTGTKVRHTLSWGRSRIKRV